MRPSVGLPATEKDLRSIFTSAVEKRCPRAGFSTCMMTFYRWQGSVTLRVEWDTRTRVEMKSPRVQVGPSLHCTLRTSFSCVLVHPAAATASRLPLQKRKGLLADWPRKAAQLPACLPPFAMHLSLDRARHHAPAASRLLHQVDILRKHAARRRGPHAAGLPGRASRPEALCHPAPRGTAARAQRTPYLKAIAASKMAAAIAITASGSALPLLPAGASPKVLEGMSYLARSAEAESEESSAVPPRW